MTTTKTELLAPAGSPGALNAAIGEGADAVYLGLKDFNAHIRSVNFTYPQFEAALRFLHRMGRRLYVTVNTVFEQREADRVYQLLKYLAALGPDGVIVQDFGTAALARENFPSLKLFASTQMNIASARGINLLSRHGFSRAVLARELSLAEIQDIRANTNVELEVFVHGGLCVSVSGLCLFSSYLGGKSANRGMCTQACRRFFTAYNHKDGLTDEESGGYYFSPADLELLGHIPALAEAGVNSFKIEGRTRSAEYTAVVVSAYRLVLDNLDAGEDALRRAIADACSILKNDFARPKTSYLINGTGETKKTAPDWLNPLQNGGTGIFLGNILRTKGRDEDKRGLIPAGVLVPSPGDSIRLYKADDSGRTLHKLAAVEKEPNGDVWISIPKGSGPDDEVYLIQTKAMTKRYPSIIPRNLEGFKRGPGREKAPEQNTETQKNQGTRNRGAKSREGFPGGFYAMVSGTEDLYILQSSRPVKVILPYSGKLTKQLSARQGLPFAAREIIISLDPFFPQDSDKELAESIPVLMESGYTQFIVNNPGHFSFFRQVKTECTLIAGPWLYTFNVWAWDFLRRCGAAYCVSPLENNRQNLEKTFIREHALRSRIFITIFAKPGLFRMRSDLRSFYGFKNFYGNGGEAFSLAASSGEGSLVYPEDSFSIIDKTPFLREAGFSRFILDFSSGPLKKAEYRELMEAAAKAVPLPGANRFNWKNGFYQ